MGEHTKTPWRIIQSGTMIVDSGGCFVASVLISPHVLNTEEPEANAAFIVKAVNNHEALVKALSDTLNMLRAAHIQCGMHHDGNERVIRAREVLAAVGGSVSRSEDHTS